MSANDTTTGELRRRLAFVPEGPPRIVLIGCVVIGLAGLLLGSAVSLSMSRVLGGHVAVRVWGLALAVGAALALRGQRRPNRPVERAGLVALGVALDIYALNVYVALGVGGIVAGTLAATLATAALWRSVGLLRAVAGRGRRG